MDATVAMDHRRVAIFIDDDRTPPTARVDRLIGDSTRSTSGGDR
jgi:hypothetical protein